MVDLKTKQEIEIPETLKACVQAIDDKKAENIVVLYVGEVSSVTDFFVIATGMSSPHLRALASELELTLKKEDTTVVKSGSADESGWYVVDAFDFMVHLFTEESRRFYNLEGLWKDGEIVSLG